MRTLLALVVLAAVLTGPLVPTAAAAHPGPCWHEYAEALLLGGVPGLVAMAKDCNPKLQSFCANLLCP